MKERRAKKEKEIEAQRKAHEEKLAQMRTANEHGEQRYNGTRKNSNLSRSNQPESLKL